MRDQSRRVDRREFARLLALGGAAPLVAPRFAWSAPAALLPTPAVPDEKFWSSVRDQFVMPRELTMLNAANLCPSSGPVLETMYRMTKDMDQDPSQDNRVKLGDGRENTRKQLAEFLRVTPEEIVITPRTKVLAVTHLTSTVGDLFPVKAICRMARERGILTLVDGAQTFGVLDVDLSDIQPDFYSGSAHKWVCGPKENGVLYINKAAQSKIWATIYSAYPGRIGVSQSFEGFGQRDEPAMMAFGEALQFQAEIGRAQIERRSRELTQTLMDGLQKVDGVKIWTSPDPLRRAAVLSFQPGNLDPRKLAAVLYQKERIGCATRAGQDRPGLRFSPHFYNTQADVERTVAAVKKYMATGV
jgi:selenocysteine lyase/cysteine desulfurase